MTLTDSEVLTALMGTWEIVSNWMRAARSVMLRVNNMVNLYTNKNLLNLGPLT